MKSITFKAVGRGHGKWLPATLPRATVPQGPSGALHDFADHWLLGFDFTVAGEWGTMGAMLFRRAWMRDLDEGAAITYISETARRVVLPQFRRNAIELPPVVDVPDPLCIRLGVALHDSCDACLSVEAFTAWVSLGWIRAAAVWGSRDGAAIAMEDAFSELMCVVRGDAVLTWDEEARRIMVTSLITRNKTLACRVDGP